MVTCSPSNQTNGGSNPDAAKKEPKRAKSLVKTSTQRTPVNCDECIVEVVSLFSLASYENRDQSSNHCLLWKPIKVSPLSVPLHIVIAAIIENGGAVASHINCVFV